MEPLEYILERLKLLEQRMTTLENQAGGNQALTMVAMEEMSKTIGLMMAQLLPIVNERKQFEKAMREVAIEKLFEYVKKTQKYPM